MCTCPTRDVYRIIRCEVSCLSHFANHGSLFEQPQDEKARLFLLNPTFKFDHSYWKYTGPTSGSVVYDQGLGQNTMVLGPNQRLMQNIMDLVVPSQDYHFKFRTKVTGADSVNLRVVIRMAYKSRDRKKSPCRKRACNSYRRAAGATISNGEWQTFVAEKFDMFRTEVCTLFSLLKSYTAL